MSLRPSSRNESLRFFLSVAILALLPLLPELVLFARLNGDLKSFGPVAYYEAIVSFLLLLPGWVAGGRFGRAWLVGIGLLMIGPTLILLFQAASVGARWDLTAHAALMQTSAGEAWGFVRAFGAPRMLLGLGAVLAGFAASLVGIVRAPMPARSHRLAAAAVGLVLAAYGLANAVRYNGPLRRAVPVTDGPPLQIINVGINKLHPVTLFAATHYNYRVTHAHYLAAFHFVSAHQAQLAGAVPAPGAAAPRVVVVVVGESASRRHWSLYGYARPTTPEVAAVGEGLTWFSDVISSNVGTQTMLRAMFSTPGEALPVFRLFSGAGYTTHWISAQYNQGENDVEVAALVQSCDRRTFLNGAYDGDLIPRVRAAVESAGKQLIFVNLFGSHVRYADRYPAAFATFRGESDKDRLVADYDNSIRYTDHVLAGLIAVLRSRPEASALLYVSDHAEDVYDSDPARYLFRNDAVATNPMYEVPFFVWLSPAYRAGNPDFSSAVAAARNRPYQTVGLYHSVIDLTRLRHPLFDPTRSVFSPDFTARERRVGVMNRRYEP